MTSKSLSNRQQIKIPEKFSQLREQAETLLHSKKVSVEDILTFTNNKDIEQIIEEFRIYHAELEIQNSELQNAILEKETLKQHYEKLFAQNPLPSLVLDSKGVIHEINDAAMAVFKVIRPIKRQRSIYQFIDKSCALEVNELLVAHHDFSHQYLTLELNKPEKGIYDCALAKLSVPETHEVRFVLMMRDISAERALEKEKTIFNQVVNNSSDTIFVIDERFNLVACNSLALAFFDLSPNYETQAVDMYDVLPDEVAKACEQVFMSNELNAQRCDVSFKQKKIDGCDVYDEHFFCRVFSIADQSTTDHLIGITITNDTERLKSEIQLDIASEIFKNSSQAIMITYPNGDIAGVNKTFETITGFTEQEVLGKNPSMLSSGLQRKNFYKHFWHSLLTQGTWQGEIWNKRKNGENYPQWLNITRVKCGENDFRYLALFDDITSVKESEQEIRKLAYHDQLTGLSNRHSLQLELTERIDKHEQIEFCLMIIDLDDFKNINDTQGHDIGDVVLQHVARRLDNIKRKEDRVFRIGGDEFVVIFDKMQVTQAAMKADQINRSLKSPYFINGHENEISCSIGMAMYPQDATKAEELLKNADIAMYNAKHMGRNCFQFFSNEMAAKVERHIQIEQSLRKALSNNETTFACQSLIELEDEQVASQELLFRWLKCPIDDLTIEELFEVAEKNGDLIRQIGQKAIVTALDQIHYHLTQRDNIRIAVNLSSQDFSDDTHFNQIFALCHSRPVEARRLDIEITERTLMENPKQVALQLDKLRALGVKVLVDDFGTGYSSFIYLRSFPVDGIKIDRAFIVNLLSSEKDLAIVKTIIMLCQSLGLISIAEGVETKAQAESLNALGCDIAQGFYFSQPQIINQKSMN